MSKVDNNSSDAGPGSGPSAGVGLGVALKEDQFRMFPLSKYLEDWNLDVGYEYYGVVSNTVISSFAVLMMFCEPDTEPSFATCIAAFAANVYMFFALSVMANAWFKNVVQIVVTTSSLSVPYISPVALNSVILLMTLAISRTRFVFSTDPLLFAAVYVTALIGMETCITTLALSWCLRHKLHNKKTD